MYKYIYDIWNENTKLINIENIYISISSFRERTLIAILQLRRGVVNHQFYYLRFKQLSKRHTKRLNNNKPANQKKKSEHYYQLVINFSIFIKAVDERSTRTYIPICIYVCSHRTYAFNVCRIHENSPTLCIGWSLIYRFISQASSRVSTPADEWLLLL